MLKRLLTIFLSLIIVLLFVSSSNAYDVRIGLQTKVSKATIGSQYESAIVDATNNNPLVKISGKQKYTVLSEGNKIKVIKNSNDNVFKTNTNSIYLIPSNDSSFIYAKNRWYRGCLKLIACGDTVTVVNVLDIEDYIKSVVPSEMPAEWSMEALKAQAVAARSYVLANINKRGYAGYDLNDTPKDQNYNGASSEHYRSNIAVEETKGQVLVSNNKIIPAYYHSSSGGVTDDIAWNGSKLNHVKAVQDFDQQSPKSCWSKSIDIQRITTRLASAGVAVGEIRGILPEKKTALGRVKVLKLIGSNGSKTIDVEKFQSLFNLPSNFFNIWIRGNLVSIQGRGSGHGIGMSQWGAKTMAERGCNVYQILGYYFKNVQVKQILD